MSYYTIHSINNIRVRKSAIILLTGLPASGKTTVARDAWRSILEKGGSAIIIDGDNFRRLFKKKLGFSVADRRKNMRRLVTAIKRCLRGEPAIILCSFIAPLEEHRRILREAFGEDLYIIYMNTPQPICEQRDYKNNYTRARLGEITQFTGINSIYEPPKRPDLTLDAATNTKAEQTNKFLIFLLEQGLIV